MNIKISYFLIAPITCKGTMNDDFFKEYMAQVLVPTMEKGSTLFLDNLSVHKVKSVLVPLYEKDINIVFLPPYSPDFSPIELAWSKMEKSYLA